MKNDRMTKEVQRGEVWKLDDGEAFVVLSEPDRGYTYVLWADDAGVRRCGSGFFMNEKRL